MWDRVIQLGFEPIKEEDYINMWYFGDGDEMTAVADCIDDDHDRVSTIQSIKEDLLCLGEDAVEYFQNESGDEWFVFHEPFKERYFLGGRYEGFVDKLDKLKKKATPDMFCSLGGLSHEMFMLKECYEEKIGRYVVDPYGDTIPFDRLARQVVVDKPYYIGGTVRYHY